MNKVNKEILKKLKNRTTWDTNSEELKQKGFSVNGIAFNQFISGWDTSEEFPLDEIKDYVRFHEWKYEDFDFENEMLVKKFLPDFIHDVFHQVKEFRSNARNMLTSTQHAYMRILGRECKTQDERAELIYDHSLAIYYKNSMLHQGE